MTPSDVRNIALWYAETLVKCHGLVVRLGYVEERGSGVYLVGHEAVSRAPTDMRIQSVGEVGPIDFAPRLVHTDTPLGDIFLGRSPVRTPKKSLNTGIVRKPAYLEGLGNHIQPVNIRLSLDILIEAYAGRGLIKYSPDEAKYRVDNGTAMFSAITNDVSVGALPGKRGYVCTRRDRVVGSFYRPLRGAPDVKRLILSRPFEHLADSMSALFREVCVK